MKSCVGFAVFLLARVAAVQSAKRGRVNDAVRLIVVGETLLT